MIVQKDIITDKNRENGLLQQEKPEKKPSLTRRNKKEV